MPPKHLVFTYPFCRRRLSVRDRLKGEFCCQKTPAWSQLNEDLVERCNIEINEDKTQGNLLFSKLSTA
jgi:hypothetical protein